jgi:hypothetical protein
MLLTFDKIRGVEFDRATQAVTDLAARMGGDLQGAAIQVGKALQDPTTGLTALRRSGVSFSESQIESSRALRHGAGGEGQRVILKELEHQFGGSAAAARDTLGGALEGLKNAFGDLFEVTRGGSRAPSTDQRDHEVARRERAFDEHLRDQYGHRVEQHRDCRAEGEQLPLDRSHEGTRKRARAREGAERADRVRPEH